MIYFCTKGYNQVDYDSDGNRHLYACHMHDWVSLPVLSEWIDI